MNRAVSENTPALVRSYRNLLPKDTSDEWSDLILQFGPQAFLCADKCRIVAYAGTHVEAMRLVTQFAETYAITPPTGGSFHLINIGQHNISCECVSLAADTILSDQAFAVHYTNGTLGWHQEFTDKLRRSNNGLSIFEGTPGTGKTSYLRHLMGTLKEYHRFYFIPASTMGILSKPEFIGFWAGQRRSHSNRKFVVILEDSDAALMTRGSDNRDQVSAILNLSDGMLADFLRLQIICTINCAVAEIDQALVRPGRLLCHRIFGRLDYSQATRLAESLGKTLRIVRDYSLAEVFAGNGSEEISRPHIGFAA